MLLPTATLPAMPTMNGVFAPRFLKNLAVAAVKLLGRAHIVVHELGDRQVDVGHLFAADALDKAGELRQLRVGQRYLNAIAQLGPFLAGEFAEGRILQHRGRIEFQRLLHTHDALPLSDREAFSACPDCAALLSTSFKTDWKERLRASSTTSK